MGRVVSQERRRASSGPGARASVASALAFALATAAPALGTPGPARMGSIHEHAAWTELLRRYLSGGLVDYASLKRDGQPVLDAYLRSLESVDRAEIESWSRSGQLAYWIDAYNAIEHGILRERFRDPRIHFAIVCASRSCPVLRAEAYRGRELDAQLDDAARAFLRDPARNRYDPASRTLFLSSIFKWFRGDFDAAAGTLPAFAARYVDAPTAEALRRGDVKIEFLDYDWSLNER